jgi:hypothetical protein
MKSRTSCNIHKARRARMRARVPRARSACRPLGRSAQLGGAARVGVGVLQGGHVLVLRLLRRLLRRRRPRPLRLRQLRLRQLRRRQAPSGRMGVNGRARGGRRARGRGEPREGGGGAGRGGARGGGGPPWRRRRGAARRRRRWPCVRARPAARRASPGGGGGGGALSSRHTCSRRDSPLGRGAPLCPPAAAIGRLGGCF